MSDTKKSLQQIAEDLEKENRKLRKELERKREERKLQEKIRELQEEQEDMEYEIKNGISRREKPKEIQKLIPSYPIPTSPIRKNDIWL